MSEGILEATKDPVPRRRRRTRIEQEVDRLQTTTRSMIPRKSFSALLNAAVHKTHPGMRLSADARTMLQEDAEHYLSLLFAKANCVALGRKRETVSHVDLRVAQECARTGLPNDISLD